MPGNNRQQLIKQVCLPNEQGPPPPKVSHPNIPHPSSKLPHSTLLLKRTLKKPMKPNSKEDLPTPLIMSEMGRKAVPNHPSNPIRKPVYRSLPIPPKKGNIRPPRGRPTKPGGPTTQMGGGETPTIAGGNDISPDTTIPHKIPPPPLG